MGRAGRDRAVTYFSEEKRTEQFLSLYQRLQTQASQSVSSAKYRQLAKESHFH